MAITLRRLNPDHIDQIIEIDQKTFPEAFLNSGEYRFNLACLLWAELKGNNYSIAAFDGDKLIGYLLMVSMDSVFHEGHQAANVLRMAVLRRYRREVVGQLVEQYLSQARLSGLSIEGQMRETTSFRMVTRHWELHLQYGFRITNMYLSDPIDSERMIWAHWDHAYSRDPILWMLYQLITGFTRVRCSLLALPRRLLRKFCTRLPQEKLPEWLRRFVYLERRHVELLLPV